MGTITAFGCADSRLLPAAQAAGSGAIFQPVADKAVRRFGKTTATAFAGGNQVVVFDRPDNSTCSAEERNDALADINRGRSDRNRC